MATKAQRSFGNQFHNNGLNTKVIMEHLVSKYAIDHDLIGMQINVRVLVVDRGKELYRCNQFE